LEVNNLKMASFFGGIGHAISRLFGGPSGAEKKQRQSLLQQEQEMLRQSEAKRNLLLNLRRAVATGRRSLLASWEDDTVGA
jgi:hypothetical protein